MCCATWVKPDNELYLEGNECINVRGHGAICLFYKSFLKEGISVIETENQCAK